MVAPLTGSLVPASSLGTRATRINSDRFSGAQAGASGEIHRYMGRAFDPDRVTRLGVADADTYSCLFVLNRRHVEPTGPSIPTVSVIFHRGACSRFHSSTCRFFAMLDGSGHGRLVLLSSPLCKPLKMGDFPGVALRLLMGAASRGQAMNYLTKKLHPTNSEKQSPSRLLAPGASVLKSCTNC